MPNGNVSNGDGNTLGPTVTSMLGVKGPLRLKPHTLIQKPHLTLRRVIAKEDNTEGGEKRVYFSLFANKRIECKPGKEILMTIASDDGRFDGLPILFEGLLRQLGKDGEEENDEELVPKQEIIPPKMRRWVKPVPTPVVVERASIGVQAGAECVSRSIQAQPTSVSASAQTTLSLMPSIPTLRPTQSYTQVNTVPEPQIQGYTGKRSISPIVVDVDSPGQAPYSAAVVQRSDSPLSAMSEDMLMSPEINPIVIKEEVIDLTEIPEPGDVSQASQPLPLASSGLKSEPVDHVLSTPKPRATRPAIHNPFVSAGYIKEFDTTASLKPAEEPVVAVPGFKPIASEVQEVLSAPEVRKKKKSQTSIPNSNRKKTAETPTVKFEDVEPTLNDNAFASSSKIRGGESISVPLRRGRSAKNQKPLTELPPPRRVPSRVNSPLPVLPPPRPVNPSPLSNVDTKSLPARVIPVSKRSTGGPMAGKKTVNGLPRISKIITSMNTDAHIMSPLVQSPADALETNASSSSIPMPPPVKIPLSQYVSRRQSQSSSNAPSPAPSTPSQNSPSTNSSSTLSHPLPQKPSHQTQRLSQTRPDLNMPIAPLHSPPPLPPPLPYHGVKRERSISPDLANGADDFSSNSRSAPVVSKRSFPWPTTERLQSIPLRGSGNLSILKIVFNSDGSQLALSCADRTIRVWNNYTHMEIARLSHNAPVIDVRWMEGDSGVISLGDDGMLSQWVRTGQNHWQWGKVLDICHERREEPGAICMAMTSMKIAIAFPNSGVKVWIWLKGVWQAQRSILRHNVTALTFINGGDALIGGTKDGVLWYCEVPNGTLRAYAIFKAPISCIDISLDKMQALVAVQDGSARLITIQNNASEKDKFGQVYATPMGAGTLYHFGAVFASRGEAVLFASAQGCLLVWNKHTAEIATGFDHGEGDDICAVATYEGTSARNLNGYIITGTNNGRLTWWPQPLQKTSPNDTNSSHKRYRTSGW